MVLCPHAGEGDCGKNLPSNTRGFRCQRVNTALDIIKTCGTEISCGSYLLVGGEYPELQDAGNTRARREETAGRSYPYPATRYWSIDFPFGFSPAWRRYAIPIGRCTSSIGVTTLYVFVPIICLWVRIKTTWLTPNKRAELFGGRVPAVVEVTNTQKRTLCDFYITATNAECVESVIVYGIK